MVARFGISAATCHATLRSTADGSGSGMSMMRRSLSTSRSMSSLSTHASSPMAGRAGLTSATTRRACRIMACVKSEITPSV
jgi:hypothetical protein